MELLQANNLGIYYFWKLNYGDPIVFNFDTILIAPNAKTHVSQYVRKVYVEADHTYSLSLDVLCTNYKSGKLGIGIEGSANSLSVSKTTDNFITLKKDFVFKESKFINVFLGGMQKASLSGEIRNVNFIDTT